MNSDSMPPRLLKVEQAAARANLGRTKIYELIHGGELESVKIGRSRRIPVEAIDDYVQRLRAAQCRVPAQAAA